MADKGRRRQRAVPVVAVAPGAAAARFLAVGTVLAAVASAPAALGLRWSLRCWAISPPRLGLTPGAGQRAPLTALRVDNRKPSFNDRAEYGETNQIPGGGEFETWTDYTKYALSVEDRFDDNFTDPFAQAQKEGAHQGWLLDRKRALGIDFGPRYTGLALSLGGTVTIPLGTVRTTDHWKDTAMKIAQIASTRRARDIVIGLPLDQEGGEEKIGRLVRHFSQIMADSVLLLLGPAVTVYLWDERYSTTYAAVRLITRPKLKTAAFKSWLDGMKGLNFNGKALLDSEAARAILEHWLDKDPETEILNKERSERVSPSKEACKAYLTYKRKSRFALPKPVEELRPKEPPGPGVEAWEWGDRHDNADFLPVMTAEEYMQNRDRFNFYMEGLNNFGDRDLEQIERSKRKKKEKEINERLRASKDERPIRDALEAAVKEGQSGQGGEFINRYTKFGADAPDGWSDPR